RFRRLRHARDLLRRRRRHRARQACRSVDRQGHRRKPGFDRSAAMTRSFVALAVFLMLAVAAQAGTFRTEAEQEATVRTIAAKLRCPVCQSENILDSRSGTAREMVDILREQLAQGRSEAEIIDFFRDRYGDYVMLSPPAS